MTRQRLGQHFLKNQAAIKKIIAALDLSAKDTIIEIGPGKGALTLPLAEASRKVGCQIVAIEKDVQLAFSVRRLVDEKIVSVKIGDALRLLPEVSNRLKLTANRFKIVGNIPYYITGKLLRVLSELEHKPSLTVLTIQREVAERITAKEGKMNLLAAAVQFWAKPEIIGYLKPADFDPPPEVDSAIVRLTPNLWKSDFHRLGGIKYYRMIKIIFKQPRKTLLNNLISGLEIGRKTGERALAEIGLPPNARPQDLNIEKIKLLVDKLL